MAIPTSTLSYSDGSSLELGDSSISLEKKDEKFESRVISRDTSDASDEARKLAGDVRTVYTQEEQDAVKRKLDFTILPLLAVVYFSQFLDKLTLNYASILDLPITGQHYSLSALAFYLGFLAFELPTNYLAQKFPLGKYLGVNIVLWSIVLALHAVAPTFGPFFTLRFFLGVFECCVTPILIKLIAAFYKTDEQPLRIGTFYLMNGMAQATGGIVSYGVTFYVGSIAPWRLMYVVFGIAAFVVGVAVLVWLPDSPTTAKFLTPRERLIAIERVRDNKTGTVTRQFKKSQAIQALTDIKTWLLLLSVLLLTIPNGGLQNYLSIITKSIGYTTREALLLSIPQGFIASISTVLTCYWAHRTKQRMVPILGAVIPSIIGMAMLVGFNVDVKKYKIGSLIGIFLTATYGSTLSLIYAWSATNVAGASKKTTTNGLLMSVFALGNIIGTNIFPSTDAPGFLPGKIAVLGLLSALSVSVLVMRWVSINMNKKKAIALAALIKEKGWSQEDVMRESDKMAFMDLTDRENPFFVYVP